MTYVGAPMIYYGDEVGMWGANDPCCRKPMVWADLRYAPEAYRIDGTKREQPDSVAVDADLLAHYRKLIQIRRRHPVLSLGTFETVAASDKDQTYAFRRNHAGQEIIVILNNSDEARRVSVSRESARWTDVLNDEQIEQRSSGLTVEVRPRWGRILIKAARD